MTSYHGEMLNPKKRRCPRCKVAFVDGDLIIMREGHWWYHVDCAKQVTAEKVEAEQAAAVAAQKPAESDWARRGRVIRKGGGL